MEKFVATWLLISSLVVLWDAGYVLLRPRSMLGGDLYWLWQPYSLYSKVDHRYGDLGNDFVYGQSWCNIIEVGFNIIAALMLLRGKRIGLILGFFALTMTFWKTVLYILLYTPLCTSERPLSHVTWSEFIFLFILTNGAWIVVPLLALLRLGFQIHSLLEPLPLSSSSSSKKKKQ